MLEMEAYTYKMERKLINSFRNEFFEKMGYYPVVYGKADISQYKLKVLTLTQLKNLFTAHLPKYYGRTIHLDSSSRIRSIVELRMIYCFIARSMKYTLKSIGGSLNKDHTTIIHNLTMFSNMMETDDLFREKYDMINDIVKKLLNEQNESSNMDESDQTSDESESIVLSRLLQIQNKALWNNKYRRGVPTSKE
jgi:hypothetical protein